MSRPAPLPAEHRGVVIRRAAEADRDGIYEVCVRTGDAGADARHLVTDHRLYGHLWAGQYLSFAPEFALVADRQGAVLGYILGALDTEVFEARLATDWWPALQSAYPLPGVGTARDLELTRRLHQPDSTDRRLTAKYPSHLHIDLLPDAQGLGLGRLLMTTMLDLMEDAGSIGVHLGVDRRNGRALAFYDHLGLRRHDHDSGVLFTCRFGA